MENRIYFLGKSKDFALAEKLYSLVGEEFEVNAKVAVTDKDYNEEDYDVIVTELGKKASDSLKVFTYSIGQGNADICGFNFQKREKSKSLDLFCMSFMGRVNIVLDSEFTEASVLYCAAGLVAAGNPLPQVLKAINLKIS